MKFSLKKITYFYRCLGNRGGEVSLWSDKKRARPKVFVSFGWQETVNYRCVQKADGSTSPFVMLH